MWYQLECDVTSITRSSVRMPLHPIVELPCHMTLVPIVSKVWNIEKFCPIVSKVVKTKLTTNYQIAKKSAGEILSIFQKNPEISPKKLTQISWDLNDKFI